MEKKHNLLKYWNSLMMLVIAFCIIMLIGAAIAMSAPEKAGVTFLVIIVIYIICWIVINNTEKKKVLQQFIEFATDYSQIQKTMLKSHALPSAMLDETGRILWMNTAFSKKVHIEAEYGKSITTVIPGITREILEKIEDSTEMLVDFEKRNFRIIINKQDFTDHSESTLLANEAIFSGYMYGVYIFDETSLRKATKELDDSQLVTGMIYIDNYEETFENIEGVKRSMIAAVVDKKISQYMESADGIVKKIEKDKYYIIFKKKYLQKLQDDKFSVLEDVKAINTPNGAEITISIGIGINPDGYVASMEYTRTAIDLAMGRGGDQAVVKEPNKIAYFGKNAKTVEKNTRVKARMKAHALREIIESKEQVVIMGHKIADVDSFGAAIGIYKACEVLNKKAHIVINEVTTSVRPLMDKFTESDNYPEDMFLTSSDAVEMVDNNTVVVVVDVNKPSYCECVEILSMTKTVVVLDHHMQIEESIENPTLYYVEAYASSTCEMVSEIIQYFAESIKLSNHEADCLYAGIMIDTNNFTGKAGVKTFEAAAYLRRCGADVTRVRKMLRNDISAYKAKAEIIKNSELYKGFAISTFSSNSVESPTIVGAQAANELLNIIGVKASIVLTEHNNTIYVSSRSIDEINVSQMMERLGGGGHGNTAGAQFENSTFEVAVERIKKLIDEMTDEGVV